eukprot:m.15607 g.15607  ORF g.15607 m.15607 type:complete len:292 (+) comp5061_c0_seq1:683-1558(+)
MAVAMALRRACGTAVRRLTVPAAPMRFGVLRQVLASNPKTLGVTRSLALASGTRLPLATRTANPSAWDAATAAVMAVSVTVGATLTSMTLCDPASLVVDPSTGLVLPAQLAAAPDSGRPAPRLFVGSGCRYKWGLVKVYAVALYVGEVDVRAAPSDGNSFVEAVATGRVPATLVIKMARDVPAATMNSALQEALITRVIQFGGGEKDLQAATALGELLLQGKANLTTETEVALGVDVTADGTLRLTVAIDGHDLGQIRNNCLCHAVLDTYAGTLAVSGEARASFVKGRAKF